MVSINIEGQKHLKSVGEFLAKEDADVVCLMEVCRDDVLGIAGEEYPFVVFAPNDVLGNIEKSSSLKPTGVAILSKTVMIDVEKEYLGERPNKEITTTKMGLHSPVLLQAKIGEYRMRVMHFTWSKKGEPSALQMIHMVKLREYLRKSGEIVLCGDFNIPRGNTLYVSLASVLKDNIPVEVETTIDPKLHYANVKTPGRLKLVVDYIWSTPKYKVKNVRVIPGVSDHCAIICTVAKN